MVQNKVYSVSEVSRMVLQALENNPRLSNLWVRGELSNFKRHTSGHLYFSLKDGQSSLKAVMFKGKAWKLNFNPQNGMDCLFRGYISLYPRDSQLQFYVEEIIPAGKGLQQAALEELKKKLQAKGYFSQERKRKLPLLPRGVGVVSSQVGAALRDIQKVIGRRYPGMPLILYPATVQGEKAALEVAEGIRTLAARDDLDVIIVARGGGSAEDLNVFNSEIVADAVFHSAKPVISAIGHEIDITVTDLVADVRVATPSMAGELAVPIKNEIVQYLNRQRQRLDNLLRQRLEREKVRMAYLTSSGVMRKPERWLNRYQDDLVRKEALLSDLMQQLYQKKGALLEVMAGKLQALSPLATLARGYSICKSETGSIVTKAEQVFPGERVMVQLSSGSLNCLVEEKEESHV